ncbi:MAG: DEAD/DEAH box helicase [Candidatus Absconditabacteria bacterium]|nr:DEAD/DEAH box helicase [Candidatus Absconditabacteria bacterium]
MLFSECGLKPGLLRSLTAMGYTEATSIQEKVLKIALTGANIVGQSQTGTGKTAAFLLPVLNKIDTNRKSVQVLILAPTRELVVQIGEEIRNLTKFYGVSFACLYGGASPNVQKANLRRSPAIVVATPGRLMDFMNQKVIDIRTVDYFILDEVDRMLDMGFVRDIKKIRAQLKMVKQTYTFSATMNNDMKTIIKEHISNYEFIKIGEEVTVDKIHHRYIPIEHEQKLFNVIKLIQSNPKDRVIIFTHTKRNTKTIHQILIGDGFNAGLLNGDMAQGKRQSTLNDFKANKTQILVTTDVAARGLNMENVGLVINFDVPADAKSYIHRIGRTGRAGAEGKAIMLVSPLERPLVQEIEKIHRIRIQPSEHIAQNDRQGAYGNLRLDRSTDKKGGKRPMQRKRLSPTQKYGKLPLFDDQKPIKTENNFRSNPKHKKHKSGLGAENRNIDRYTKPAKQQGGKFRGMGKPKHK